MQSGNHLAEPARKRLRTSHACDLCRGRKIRCDGNNPCAACVAADNACTYGSEANSRGKSELILESVMRLERSLQDIHESISLITPRPDHQTRQPILPPISVPRLPRASFSGSSLAQAPIPSPYQPSRISQVEAEPAEAENLENAVLETWHTSTTEAVLNWTHFHAFPSLRDDYIPIFQLEQTRTPITLRSNSTIFPYLTPEEIDEIIESFSQNINFWYPTTSLDQIQNTRRMMISGGGGILDTPSPNSVLALLIMALGCASQMCSGLYPYRPPHLPSCTSGLARPHTLATIFFSLALSKIYIAHTTPSSTSTHCLFFTAIYFAYLRRPLQAWEYISSAASKCMLFLSYPLTPSSNSGDMERIRRIFWACYILESDYLAELSSLPLSGIARIESSVPLPGAAPGVEYRTQEDETENDRSSCYFLACISMRRLLNRVHQLLYARDVGAGNDRARFPFVVAELSAQLEEWRDVLPSIFKFEVAPLGKGTDHTRDDNSLNSGSRISDMLTSGDEETRKEAQKLEHSRRGFLRQRYLTCRSVIYRPYLMWMLNGGSASMLVETSTPLPSIPSPISARGAPHSLSSPVPTTPSDVSGNAREHQGQDMLRHTKACLDACLLHILNLRGFAQTVMVDTWICSLSMAGAMLVLLAAIRIPSLRSLIGPEVLAAGDHLRGLLEEWQRVLGDPKSPSVDQSIRIIREADRFIKEAWGPYQHHGTPLSAAPLMPLPEGSEA